MNFDKESKSRRIFFFLGGGGGGGGGGEGGGGYEHKGHRIIYTRHIVMTLYSLMKILLMVFKKEGIILQKVFKLWSGHEIVSEMIKGE